MDEMIVRPKYSRQTGTPRKSRRQNENDMMSTIFAAKMLAVVVFLSVFALCKAADTPTTNYFVSKVKLITTENFDANKYLLSAANALGVKLPEKNAAAGSVTGPSTDSGSVEQTAGNGSSKQEISDQNGADMKSSVQSSQIPDSIHENIPGTETGSEVVSSSISDTIKAISQVPVLEEAEIKALADKYSFVIPIKGQIDSPFGVRTDPLSGNTVFHSGIDIKANMGTSIKAALDGEVTEVGSSPEYDKYVKVKHDEGVYTVYAHCSILVAKQGQKVKQGDVIAKVGDTEGLPGAYLHFEVWKGDKAADPEKLLNLLNQ
ncbi:M23 family metallopeptidase [Ruminiclostridium cellobioparum]|uniref:M23 family metallopeptidase n=1 Tax=Ruminiclostridium cellobioparum TaxID=29355 RepID=UPI0004889BFA|nr:M23 family metallopeptidase [Ruminiclostridium cellobioparum]